MTHFFDIGSLPISSDNLFLIAGPCVLDETDVAFEIATAVKGIADSLQIPFIFKASYTKANRTSSSSYRGLGVEKGLEKLLHIKKELGVPVLTDVHEPEEAKIVGQEVDVLQIPAFLCRQTFLLEACAQTGKAVNIKKGQFLAPWDMEHAAKKIAAAGNNKVLLTERGTSFGYNRLVVDMCTFPIMEKFGYPTIFDGTHSVQLPGAGQGETSGLRDMIPYLVRSAVAAGCHGLFLEVHPQPESSPSDRASILPLDQLQPILEDALAIKESLSKASS